jgi:hypothetical protein
MRAHPGRTYARDRIRNGFCSPAYFTIDAPRHTSDNPRRAAFRARESGQRGGPTWRTIVNRCRPRCRPATCSRALASSAAALAGAGQNSKGLSRPERAARDAQGP